MSTLDEQMMTLALAEAARAGEMGEVPIGCVIVHNEKVIARACNRRETEHDPTGHAEMPAIREAAKALGRWRLTGCTLYVTLEPCVMCAGAIVLARLDRVVYGATDKKAGAIESLYRILADERLNHMPEVLGGVLADSCGEMLSAFFRRRRNDH